MMEIVKMFEMDPSVHTDQECLHVHADGGVIATQILAVEKAP